MPSRGSRGSRGNRRDTHRPLLNVETSLAEWPAADHKLPLSDSSLETPPPSDGQAGEWQELGDLAIGEVSVCCRPGLWGGVFNLCNSALGAGILSFPYAFSLTGLSVGLLCTGLTALTLLATLLIVLEFQLLAGSAQSYQQLIRSFLGPTAERVCQVFLVVYFFLSCVAYLVVIGDQCQGLVGSDRPEWFLQRPVAVLAFAVLLVLPLSLLQSIASLGFSSFLALASCVYLAAMVVARAPPEGFQHMEQAKVDLSLFQAVPPICFAFQCHGNSVAIYAELPKASQDRRVFSLLCLISMLFCFLLYSTIGVAGYATFLDETRSDILLNYDGGDIQVSLARVGMLAVGAFSYPICHFVARSAYLDLWRTWTGRADPSNTVKNGRPEQERADRDDEEGTGAARSNGGLLGVAATGRETEMWEQAEQEGEMMLEKETGLQKGRAGVGGEQLSDGNMLHVQQGKTNSHVERSAVAQAEGQQQPLLHVQREGEGDVQGSQQLGRQTNGTAGAGGGPVVPGGQTHPPVHNGHNVQPAAARLASSASTSTSPACDFYVGTLLFLALSVVMALYMPNIGTVIGVMGALGSCSLIFLVPGLLLRYGDLRGHERRLRHRALAQVDLRIFAVRRGRLRDCLLSNDTGMVLLCAGVVLAGLGMATSVLADLHVEGFTAN
eukprot:g47708.t1